MDDIFVLKAADDMDDGVNFTYIGQELVSQAFTLGSPLDQTRDIHEFDHGRGHLFGVIHLAEQPDALVRDRDHTHVGVNGAEGIVGRLCSCFCQRVKQCALADIRQTYDS